MARVLSISYDETLLRTRELMLKSAGHSVHSAFGYHDGMEACASGNFNLFILGHSIPHKDKLDLIGCFRQANPSGEVISLVRAGEPRLHNVEHYLNPGDPEELMRAIEHIVDPRSDRRRDWTSGLRRVK